MSGGDNDPRNRPKGSQSASEPERACSEQAEGGNSPMRPPDDSDDPRGKVNVSGVSGHANDPRNWPNKLWNALEQIPAWSDQSEEGYSPGRPPEEPNAPDDETVVPGDLQGTQGCPRADGNARGGETNPPS